MILSIKNIFAFEFEEFELIWLKRRTQQRVIGLVSVGEVQLLLIRLTTAQFYSSVSVSHDDNVTQHVHMTLSRSISQRISWDATTEKKGVTDIIINNGFTRSWATLPALQVLYSVVYIKRIK